jgi:hypothetical protein
VITRRRQEYEWTTDFSSTCKIIIIIIIILPDSAAQCGLWPPRPRGFLITHNDASQSVGLLRTSDQLVAEPVPDNTHQTNIHAPGGIGTKDRSRQAAVNLRLTSSAARPLGPAVRITL